MNRLRYLAVIAVTAAVLVFALQNLHGVTVDVLVWRFTASVTLITLGPFLAGLLVGLVGTMLVRRRARAAAPPAPDDGPGDVGP